MKLTSFTHYCRRHEKGGLEFLTLCFERDAKFTWVVEIRCLTGKVRVITNCSGAKWHPLDLKKVLNRIKK